MTERHRQHPEPHAHTRGAPEVAFHLASGGGVPGPLYETPRTLPPPTLHQLSTSSDFLPLQHSHGRSHSRSRRQRATADDRITENTPVPRTDHHSSNSTIRQGRRSGGRPARILSAQPPRSRGPTLPGHHLPSPTSSPQPLLGQHLRKRFDHNDLKTRHGRWHGAGTADSTSQGRSRPSHHGVSPSNASAFTTHSPHRALGSPSQQTHPASASADRSSSVQPRSRPHVRSRPPHDHAPPQPHSHSLTHSTHNKPTSRHSRHRVSRTLARDPFAKLGRDPMASTMPLPSPTASQPGGRTAATHSSTQGTATSPSSYTQMHLAKLAHKNSGRSDSGRQKPVSDKSTARIDHSSPPACAFPAMASREREGRPVPVSTLPRLDSRTRDRESEKDKISDRAPRGDVHRVPSSSTLMSADFGYANCERVQTTSSRDRGHKRLNTAPVNPSAEQSDEMPLGPNFPELRDKMFNDSSPGSLRHSRRDSRCSDISSQSAPTLSNHSDSHSSRHRQQQRQHTMATGYSQRQAGNATISPDDRPLPALLAREHTMSSASHYSACTHSYSSPAFSHGTPPGPTSKPYVHHTQQLSYAHKRHNRTSSGRTYSLKEGEQSPTRILAASASAASPVRNLTLLKQKTSRRGLRTAPTLHAYATMSPHSITAGGHAPKRHFPFSQHDSAASAPPSPLKHTNPVPRARTMEPSVGSEPRSDQTRLIKTHDRESRPNSTRTGTAFEASRELARTPPSKTRPAQPTSSTLFDSRHELPRTPPNKGRQQTSAQDSPSRVYSPIPFRRPQSGTVTRTQPVQRTPPQTSHRMRGSRTVAVATRNVSLRMSPTTTQRGSPGGDSTSSLNAQRGFRRARTFATGPRARVKHPPDSLARSQTAQSHAAGPDPTFSPSAGGRFTTNPARLESMTDEWVKVLSVSTTGDSDWQACMECLANIRKLIHSRDIPHEQALQLVAKFRAALVSQLSGLRSTLVKSVCVTLSDVFEVFGDKYARTAGLYLSPLFKLLQANGAMSSPAHQCILSMIKHICFPYLIEFLLDRATTAKAEILRVRATQYLDTIVVDKEWRRVVHFRDSTRMKELVTVIVKQTNDRTDKVRKEARKLACDFAREFPQTARGIFSRANARTQRLLSKECPRVFGGDEQHVLSGKREASLSSSSSQFDSNYSSSFESLSTSSRSSRLARAAP